MNSEQVLEVVSGPLDWWLGLNDLGHEGDYVANVA
jgi:hypothetical protein